jgi:hypothetical protein
LSPISLPTLLRTALLLTPWFILAISNPDKNKIKPIAKKPDF